MVVSLPGPITGPRKGEALALTREDFDFKAKTINVSKSVYYDPTEPKIKLPKTAAGIRTVPILDPLLKKIARRFALGVGLAHDGHGKSVILNRMGLHNRSVFAQRLNKQFRPR